MIDSFMLVIGILLTILFLLVWLIVIPFVIMHISKNIQHLADENEKIRHTLNDIEKELEQLSK